MVMQVKVERRHYGYWTKEGVIEGIQDRLSKGLSLTPKVMRIEDSGLIANGEKYYGYWWKALEEAGVDYMDWYTRKPNGYWTKAKIKKKLKQRKKDGLSIKAVDVKAENSVLYNGIISQYVTWSAVLKSIDEYNESNWSNQPKRDWSKETVRTESLKRLDDDKSIVTKDIQKDDNTLYEKMISLYGTVHKAYESIGEDPKDHTFKREIRKWSKEVILEELSIREDNWQSISSTVVNVDDRCLYLNGVKLFGGWANVRKALKEYNGN